VAKAKVKAADLSVKALTKARNMASKNKLEAEATDGKVKASHDDAVSSLTDAESEIGAVTRAKDDAEEEAASAKKKATKAKAEASQILRQIEDGYANLDSDGGEREVIELA